MQVNIEHLIQSATSEFLLAPNFDLNAKVIQSINQNESNAQKAALLLVEKLKSKNPKIQMLALSIIEISVENCGMHFKMQIASKKFIGTLMELLSEGNINPQVKEYILNLVQQWGFKYSDSQSLKYIPLFQETYKSMIQLGFKFPQAAERQKQPNQQSLKPLQKRQIQQYKIQKLKNDLQIVKENVSLTNELINGHDLKIDVNQNELLQSQVRILKAMNKRILVLIEKCENEEIVNSCLFLTEDIKNTVERYQELLKGQFPLPFQSSEQTIQKTPEIIQGIENLNLLGQQNKFDSPRKLEGNQDQKESLESQLEKLLSQPEQNYQQTLHQSNSLLQEQEKKNQVFQQIPILPGELNQFGQQSKSPEKITNTQDLAYNLPEFTTQPQNQVQYIPQSDPLNVIQIPKQQEAQQKDKLKEDFQDLFEMPKNQQ